MLTQALPLPEIVRARVFPKPTSVPKELAVARDPPVPIFPGPAYIFHCNDKTRRECVQRKLFGCPSKGKYISIAPGAVLFLFNFQKKSVEGPFRAVSELQQNIVAEAWEGRFSWQCRIDKMSEDSNIVVFDRKNLIDLLGTGRLDIVDERTQQALVARFMSGGWKPPAPAIAATSVAPSIDSKFARKEAIWRQATLDEEKR